jgi:hypothetical protein
MEWGGAGGNVIAFHAADSRMHLIRCLQESRAAAASNPSRSEFVQVLPVRNWNYKGNNHIHPFHVFQETTI